MDLEQRIKQIRNKPLLVLCRMPNGRERVLSVDDCIRSGGRYIHVVEDELDATLAEVLEGDCFGGME